MTDWPGSPVEAPAAPQWPGQEVGSSSSAIAATTANDNPDQAAKILNFSKKTSAPPSLIEADLPSFEGDYKKKVAVEAVNSNPAIAAYVAKNPRNASVSADDYEQLNKVSDTVRGLTNAGMADSLTFGLAKEVPAIANYFTSGAATEKLKDSLRRAKEGFVGGFGNESEVDRMLGEARGLGLSQTSENLLNAIGALPAARAVEAGLRTPGGIIGGAAGAVAGLVGTSPAEADRLQRDLKIFGDMAMVATGEVKPQVGTLKPEYWLPKTLADHLEHFASTPDAVHEYLAEHTKGGPRYRPPGGGEPPPPPGGGGGGGPRDLSAGATPPSDMWQSKPVIDTIRAQVAKDALQETIDVAQDSKTKVRSPDHFEEFLNSHEDMGSVHVPANAILDLYDKEGKVPMQGDGLFGFVPGLAEKLVTAVDEGAEVKIPLSKYVSHIDPTVHEGLADLVRVQEKGVTVEEAKAAKEAQDTALKAEGEPAPVKTEEQFSDNPIENATIKAVKRERTSLYLHPLFADESTLNLSKGDFERYSKLIDRSQEKVLTRAVELARQEVARREKPEWKKNEETIRTAVSAELEQDPAYLADRYFNFDKGMLPNGKRHIMDTWKPMDQVKADEFAPLFGFESGSEMATAVIAREVERTEAGKGPKWQFKQHVEAETARRMEEKYGNLADNIALEASDIALSDWNVDLLSAELKMLSKEAGVETPLTRDELTRAYKEQFDRSVASEVSYETHRRAAEKAGREAESALLKGKFEDALVAKQKQMVAYVLAREAKGFEKEMARAEKLFGKYTNDVTLEKVSQEYTDQVHRLLQQVGYDVKRTAENVDYNLQGKPFNSFVEAKNANGAMIIQAEVPTVRPGQNARPIDLMTVDQFRDFTTMIESLDHNGRAEKMLDLFWKKEAYEKVIDTITKNLDTMEKTNFDPYAKGVIGSARRVGRWVDSNLLKVEKMLDWIDQNNPLGAFNSAVLRGLVEGEQRKGDMLTKLAGMARDLPMTRKWGKALNDHTTNLELADLDGKLMKLTNENKIAIALNWGNEGNRRVMLEGYKWDEKAVESYLARELTAEDKQAVDALHGLFEPLAPLVEETTRRRSGVAVPLIQPKASLGMKGGYYPLVSDPRKVLIGQQTETDLFQKVKYDPLPTAPALKQRTGAVYPIDLELGNIHNVLSRTTHAVMMQEAVINANKVISDGFVREGVAKAFGPEYVEMLDKWIRDIANNGGSDQGWHDNRLAWVSRNVRQNVITQLMGWKVSTALIHGGSAAASSAFELGKMSAEAHGSGMHVLSPALLVNEMRKLGLEQFLPTAAQKFFGNQGNALSALEVMYRDSGEMRNRQRGLQKDFGFEMNKVLNATTMDDLGQLRAIHQSYSMAMVAYLDQLTATPVWHAARDKALHEGMEYQDAVYTADKAVREAHGSASLVARANVGRGEINKWLTIAYNGYWNHNYNKMRDTFREVAQNPEEALGAMQRVAIGGAFVTAMIVAPALVHHAVRGQEADTTGGAIAGMLASQFGGTVPIINGLTYSFIHNKDPSVSPIEDVLKSVVDVARDIKKEEPKTPIKHAAKALGFLTGLPPTNQAIDTFSFLNDVTHREQDPASVQEWARGLMTGHAEKKGH